MNVFPWNARARNTHVEATLNHPFPAQVQDERFDDACVALEQLSNELHYAGRLGKPGAKPPLRLANAANANAKGGDDGAATFSKGAMLAALAAETDAAAASKQKDDDEDADDAVGARPDDADETQAADGDPQDLESRPDTAGDDWLQYFDDDGHPYWFNQMTGESTYDAPGHQTHDAPQAYDQAADWSQAYDDQGNVYWYNAATGVSQYEDPFQYDQLQYDDPHAQYDDYGNPVDPYAYADPNAAADPNGDWAQYQDEAGNWYWHNQATGESTYDQPA